MEKRNAVIDELMDQRFGHDSLIALATVENGEPFVRTVNAYYTDGSFYVVTYAASRKMQQIQKHPAVAICGDWFTAHAIGENLGHVLLEANQGIMESVRKAFSSWYANGHTNEADPNTCLLRLRLTDGLLLSHGERYEIDFR